MAGKLLFITAYLAVIFSDVESYRLDKVVILGRHNLRAPLIANLLEKVTPNVWPIWTDPPAYLTSKGRLLESYMGEYFSQWLQKENLFRECPKRNATLIYANAPERTRETAKVFTESAFRNCNFTVIFKENVIMDPVFHPIIRNKTDEFKQRGVADMERRIDELQLDNAYEKLNEILKINISRLCNDTNFCDLRKKKDVVLFKIGEEPNIYGPLSIGNSVLDNFLMMFYNGTPLNEIGWGSINEDDWKTLTEITKENQNIRFNSVMAPHLSELLLRQIKEIVLNDDLKFALLVGHDSNITPLLTTLRVKHFELPNQYERTPVGGKLVFQKWYDESRDIFLLKIDYVYQTTEQLRNGTKLSLESPPNSVTLELSDCKTDKNGFCAWKDFINILSKFE